LAACKKNSIAIKNKSRLSGFRALKNNHWNGLGACASRFAAS
jgi:hypothetical protein